MIRRLPLAGAALVTLATLSSCATFTEHRDAARVGDIVLSEDSIDDLLGLAEDGTAPDADPAAAADTSAAAEFVDGNQVRSALTQWIRIVLVESAVQGKPHEEIASTANLEARLGEALDALAARDPEAGRSAYEQGLSVSSVLCLGAIPVADEAQGGEVLAAISGGQPFAEAAAQFSTDPTLAENGGVITDDNGDECFDATTIAPAVVEALAGKAPGTPALVTLGDFSAVIQLRPYDQLSDEGRAQIAQLFVAIDTLPKLVDEGDVRVDPRYGYWDTASASVLPLGG